MKLEIIVEKFLTKRGWHTYYNPKYWVHKKLVKDPSTQDYTNYGMDLESAFIHEVEAFEPFLAMGIPRMSQLLTPRDKTILDYYFKDSK